MHLWHDLCEIGARMADPWIVLGDFNNVLNKNERHGSSVSLAEVHYFRQCVDSCDLQDLKATGPFFTWTNKQLGVNRVCSKIDRVLIHSIWLDSMPDSTFFD